MKAKSFDRQFDSGHDMTEHLDLSEARRPRLAQKRVNVDFPTWMIDSLDKEASRIGVTRQSIIKLWLAERLETAAANASLNPASEPLGDSESLRSSDSGAG